MTTSHLYGYYRDPVSRALLHSLRSMYYPPAVELKTVLSVDPGAMTRMLDRLACKGWIERLPNPADKRGVLVQLTPGRRSPLRAVSSGCGSVTPGVNEKSVGGRSRHA